MRRGSTTAVVLMSIALVVCCGLLTVARADDDDDDKGRNNKNNKKSDFALFDGTNPATEAPPNGGAECTVKGPATFYGSVSAHSSGPAGFVRVTFSDGDWVQFPIASNGSFSFTHAIGGTKGVDDRIRISNGGDAGGARLVGWVSVHGSNKVACQSCAFNDGAGGNDCQNSP